MPLIEDEDEDENEHEDEHEDTSPPCSALANWNARCDTAAA
jgi:hypothetical protein